MSLRNSPPARCYYRLLEASLLPLAGRAGLTPTAATLAGLGLAGLVPPGFLVHPGLGLAFMLASGIADSLDGMIARRHGGASRFGAFLDSTSDRVADSLYLLGFWVLFLDRSDLLPATLLVFSAALLSGLVSYTKARAEGLGGSCPSSLMDRGARTVYLLAWALLLAVLPGSRGTVLWTGLGLYCLLALAALLQRIRGIRDSLRG